MLLCAAGMDSQEGAVPANLNDIGYYIDHTFAASQQALLCGDAAEFRKWAEMHAGLAELWQHVKSGGLIN